MKSYRALSYMFFIAAAAILALAGMPGCTAGGTGVPPAYGQGSADMAIDYSRPVTWLSRPSKPDRAVDIFYVYPTVYKRAQGEPEVCELNNISMVAGASRQLQGQATAFEPVGNIFAPYYRQASSDILALPYGQQQAILTGIPKSCVFAAFDYYINTLNQGRPFILAGHSQGSNILLYLLSEYMALHPDVYRRMIAAYVIGYSVTPDYLARNPHLKFATGPDDTGVIISYNTEAPVLLPPGDPVVLPGALVINPISWTTEETLAPASQSAGSLVMNPDGTVALDTIPVMNYADARVDRSRNALICSSVNQQSLIPVTGGASIGVYHSLDYALYYFNVRQNAQNRVNRYLGR